MCVANFFCCSLQYICFCCCIDDVLFGERYDVNLMLSHVVDAVRLKLVTATTMYCLAGCSPPQVDSTKVKKGRFLIIFGSFWMVLR